MSRLFIYWHKLWAEFSDELSFSLTRDKVSATFSTTPARFAFYMSVVAGVAVAVSAALGVWSGGPDSLTFTIESPYVIPGK